MEIQKTAAGILAENIQAWGSGKNTFFAFAEELQILKSAGALVIQWNHNNNDGTYSHELSYQDYTFKGSTTQPIN